MQKELLSKVRFHWHSYVARGGLAEPITLSGVLEKGGIEHWANFLKHSREYAKLYGCDELKSFVPEKLIKLLTGA